MKVTVLSVLILIGSLFNVSSAQGILNVLEEGAVGDGIHNETKAIQKAIDQCSEKGGGTVLLPPGKYVIGTLYLKSNIVFRISEGAVLFGSPRIDDYTRDTHKNLYKNEPHLDRCLIFAKNAHNITIEGRGCIDGQGQYFPNPGDPQKNRPMMIRFLECQNVKVRDVTLFNPAAWTSAWLYCKDLDFQGVTISSRINWNGDGFDFDGCENVRVSDCNINTSDDSICLQTSLPERPCRDVSITNCHFSSHWAGVRIGLLSRGDFENVVISNCTFRNMGDSGLKIQMCEGGKMSNMVFDNLVMKNVPRPVFMTFCQQRAGVDSPPEVAPMKSMRGFQFNNITVDNEALDKNSAFIFTGVPGHPIENISISNVQGFFSGGGTKEDAQGVLKELTLEVLKNWWPEYNGLGGTVPAHGIYARHVKGLVVRNARFELKNKDERPQIQLESVTQEAIESSGSIVRVKNRK